MSKAAIYQLLEEDHPMTVRRGKTRSPERSCAVGDWQGLYDALQAVRNKVLDALDKLERKKPLIMEAMADCNEADQRLMDM